jgi:hypothetical protein
MPIMSEPSDSFADTYMAPSGAVLHRGKLRSRGLAALLLGFSLFAALATGATMLAPGPLFLPILMGVVTVFFAFCGVAFSVIRTTVSANELHVQLGLWGPRVPLEAIESCRVIDYDWKKFGGFGLKRAFDGTWSYTVAMDRPVVEVRWTENGKKRAAVFNAEDPEAVAAAVQRGREMKLAQAPGARIEATNEATGALDAELDAMADDEAVSREERAS